MITTTRLHHHDLFIWEVGLQLGQTFVEISDGTFIIRIVRCAYDIIVDFILLDAFEEGYVKRRVIGALLRVDDDLRVGTDLTTSSAGILQRLCEGVPVVILVSSPCTVGFHLAAIPKHTEADLIACLDEVRSRASVHQCLQTHFRVGIDVFECRGVYHHELLWQLLLPRISPSVAVVEVEHELQACVLDALAEFLHVFQILAHALPFCLVSGQTGIHEESHAHGVQPLFLQEAQHVADFLAILVHVVCTMFFVGRQQGDVATHVFLCLHGSQTEE